MNYDKKKYVYPFYKLAYILKDEGADKKKLKKLVSMGDALWFFSGFLVFI